MPDSNPAPAAAPHGVQGRQALLAMLGICLVVLLASLDQTVVGTAMPHIVAELNGFALYPWVATIYLLTSTVTTLVIGKLGDLFGRKRFLLASILIFVGASAAAGVAPTMLVLIVARGVQGIGGGMLTAVAFTIIADLFPQPERRARWQGITAGVLGIASVIGPLLGGLMTDAFGWRSVFYINLPLGVVSLLVVWYWLPESPRAGQAHGRVDWAGAGLITVAISALLLALEWGGKQAAWTSSTILGLFGLSLVALGAFLWVEHRAAEPILPLGLFAMPLVAVTSAMSLLIGFAMFAVVNYTPLLAQGALGMSASASGALQTPLVVCVTATSIVAGFIYARIPRPKLLLIAGAALMVVGTLLLTQTTRQTSAIQISAELALCGVGIGLLLPILTTVVQAGVPAAQLGVTTSLVQFTRSIGSTFGTALVGVIVIGTFGSQFMLSAPANADPRLLSIFSDPQALISAEALQRAEAVAAEIGAGGTAQVQQLFDISREVLAGSVVRAYWMACGSAVLVLLLALMFPAVRTSNELSETGVKPTGMSVG